MGLLTTVLLSLFVVAALLFINWRIRGTASFKTYLATTFKGASGGIVAATIVTLLITFVLLASSKANAGEWQWGGDYEVGVFFQSPFDGRGSTFCENANNWTEEINSRFVFGKEIGSAKFADGEVVAKANLGHNSCVIGEDVNDRNSAEIGFVYRF